MTINIAEPGSLSRSDRLLLAGLVSSLLAIGLGPVVPGIIRGITLTALVVGLAWSVSTQRARTPLAWWPLVVVTIGVLPGLLASRDFQVSLDVLHFLPIGFAVYLGIILLGIPARTLIALASLLVIALISIDGTLQYLFSTGLLSGQEIAGNRVRSSMPHPNDIAIIPMLLPVALLGVKGWGRRTISSVAIIFFDLSN